MYGKPWALLFYGHPRQRTCRTSLDAIGLHADPEEAPSDDHRAHGGSVAGGWPMGATRQHFSVALRARRHQTTNSVNRSCALAIMSDSDANVPSDAAITNKLRDVVISIHKSGKTEDLTVKRVRARAEKELGLSEGFFKTSSEWKGKSEQQIRGNVVCPPCIYSRLNANSDPI